MWPWGHLAIGYLLYTTGCRWRGARPEAPEVLLLAFGTQLPDLVDKPLAWTFDVLVSGRSLGHSLLLGIVLLGAIYILVPPRLERSGVIAFGVGYLSHPLADFPIGDVLAGDWSTTAYFVWPLRSMPPDEPALTILGYLLAFDPGPYEYVQIGLCILGLGVWHLDGQPGRSYLGEQLDRS